MTRYILGNESDVTGFPLTDTMAKFVDSIPTELSSILNQISENNGGVWIVGGAVRDAAMGFMPSDIDLATDLLPGKLLEIFPDAIETGIAFGTITIRSGTYLFQTTTLRSDGDYLDSRRPETVTYNLSLNQDLKRRDFTINSMAIDVARRLYYDPNNGMVDIENRIIRCVGNAEKRINEDALRILRAYRFLGQINTPNWELEENLSTVIINNSFLIRELASERIWQELFKILSCKKSQDIVCTMIEHNVLSTIFDWDNIETTKLTSALRLRYNLDYIALFVLLNYHLKAEDITNLCKKMKLSKSDSKAIYFTYKMSRIIPQNNTRYLRFYRHLIGERWHEILLLSKLFSIFKIDDILSTATPEYFSIIITELQKLEPNKTQKPLIDGNWLMSATNIKQGEKLGRLKDWLYRIQIENDLDNKSQIEQYLAKLPWQDDNYHQWPEMKLQ